MNAQVNQYSNLTIPESKREDFLHDVRQVADQAGLFAIRHMRVYDQEFDLLCFPKDQEDVCFDYSYFENLLHEKDTIDAETRRIQSNIITSGPFGAAVQALSMLAESYSNTYFCCDNRVGLKEMRWLCYVLDRPIILPCHTTVWDFYEQYMLNNGDDMKSSAMDIIIIPIDENI